MGTRSLWQREGRLYTVHPLKLTDGFEILKDKRLVLLNRASGGPAELISMER